MLATAAGSSRESNSFRHGEVANEAEDAVSAHVNIGCGARRGRLGLRAGLPVPNEMTQLKVKRSGELSGVSDTLCRRPHVGAHKHQFVGSGAADFLTS